jgi:hypothetical protein
MANAKGERQHSALRFGFERRIKLEVHGVRISSAGGLLAHRDLDDVLGLTDMAASIPGNSRPGRNSRRQPTGAEDSNFAKATSSRAQLARREPRSHHAVPHLRPLRRRRLPYGVMGGICTAIAEANG